MNYIPIKKTSYYKIVIVLTYLILTFICNLALKGKGFMSYCNFFPLLNSTPMHNSWDLITHYSSGFFPLALFENQ